MLAVQSMKAIFLLFTAIVLSACPVEKKDRRPVEHQDTTTAYSETTLKLKSNHIPYDVFKMTRLRKLSVIGMDCDYTHTLMTTETMLQSVGLSGKFRKK